MRAKRFRAGYADEKGSADRQQQKRLHQGNLFRLLKSFNR